MRISRTVATLGAACAIVIGLTGCSGGTTAESPTAASAARATATPTPTPTAMSVDEAGKYFLATMCPVNAASAKLNSALGGTDLEAVHSSAKEMIPAAQETARRLDDGSTLWPSAVDKKDVTALRDYYLGALSGLNSIAIAPDVTSAQAVSFPGDTAAGPASQRIRLRLNLSADTSQGC
jgi:hypothetical protein